MKYWVGKERRLFDGGREERLMEEKKRRWMRRE